MAPTQPEAVQIFETDNSGTERLRARLLLFAKVLLSVGLIAYLLSVVEIEEIGRHIVNADRSGLLVALAVMSIIAPLSGLRWYLVARSIRSGLPVSTAVSATYIGQLFGQVLPASVGCDAIRGWYAYRIDRKVAVVAGGLLIDRMFGLLTLAILILVSAPVLGSLSANDAAWAISVAAAAVVGTIGVLLALGFLPNQRVTKPRILVSALDALGSFRRGMWSGTALGAACVSFGIHLVYVYTAVLIAQSLGINIDFLPAIAIVMAVTLITNLPISFSGWGVREGAMVVGMGLLGVGSGEALTVSVLLGLGLILIALPGLPLWFVARSQNAASDVSATDGTTETDSAR